MKNHLMSVTGILIGVSALFVSATSAAWIAGSFGISAAAAGQIVAAINAGGWALTVITIVFGGGIISAIIAVVRKKAMQLGATALTA
jgi:circularin A/uberolysin family circular bacteriocin